MLEFIANYFRVLGGIIITVLTFLGWFKGVTIFANQRTSTTGAIGVASFLYALAIVASLIVLGIYVLIVF